MKGFVRLLMAVTAAAGGLMLVAPSAMAQKPVEIKYHCKVKGYSDWVRIDPGSKSGGEVLRGNGELVTDRVMRGEQLRVSINDTSFTRKCKCSFLLEAQVSSKNRKVFDGEIAIPFQRSFVVSGDADFDNVVVTVFDPIASGGKVDRRVPIGSRPKKYH